MKNIKECKNKDCADYDEVCSHFHINNDTFIIKDKNNTFFLNISTRYDYAPPEKKGWYQNDSKQPVDFEDQHIPLDFSGNDNLKKIEEEEDYFY